MLLGLILVASCRCEHPKDAYMNAGYGAKPHVVRQVPTFGIIITSAKSDMAAVQKYCVGEICSVGLALSEEAPKDPPFTFYPAKDFYVVDGDWVNMFAIDTGKLEKNKERQAWLTKELAVDKPKWKIAYGVGEVKGWLAPFLNPMFAAHHVGFFFSASASELVEKDGTNYLGVGDRFVHLLLNTEEATISIVDKSGKVILSRVYKRS